MAKLSDVYFFHDLTPRERERIASIAVERTYEPGEVIVTGNTDITSFYVVVEGKVAVSIPLEDRPGREGDGDEVLGHIGPGECFGEFSYADRKPASAWIVAEEPAVVFELPHHEFDQILDAEPALARKVLKSMLAMVVHRFRSTDAELMLTRYIAHYV